MSFYDRYAQLCYEAGLKPASQEACEKIGVQRATVSNWKKTGNIPVGATIRRIAEVYNVSPEFLIGTEPVSADTKRQQGAVSLSGIAALFSQLDEVDKIKVEAYIQGLLSKDKYGAQN